MALYCYIAGPMTKGNQFDLFKDSVLVADCILKRGHAVFLPHLSFFWNLIKANDYERWLQQDFLWIRKCNVLVRIPGESEGADREVEFAKSIGVKVFMGLEEFMSSSMWTEVV